MRRRMIIAGIIVLVAAVVALPQDQPGRDRNPRVDGGEVAGLADGLARFAVDMYATLRRVESGNLVFSPYSVWQAFAMTWAGARGETETQMGRVLRFPLPQAGLHTAFNKLDLGIARAAGAGGPSAAPTIFIASALWPRKGYPILPEFVKTLRVEYGVELEALDYNKDAKSAVQAINKWVSDRTAAHIPAILDSLEPDTRLVVASAVYFLGRWEKAFDPRENQDEDFYPLNGRTARVPFMIEESALGLHQRDRLTAIELPYAGREFSLLIMMPEEGSFRDFENRLTAEVIASVRGNLSAREVLLHLPRFTDRTRVDLKKALSAMGMTLPFDRWEADFSGISRPPAKEEELYIAESLHESTIDVVEKGTEATAATVVMGGVRGSAQQDTEPTWPIEIVIDRPFTYCILHRATGAMLFLGRVVDPSRHP